MTSVSGGRSEESVTKVDAGKGKSRTRAERTDAGESQIMLGKCGLGMLCEENKRQEIGIDGRNGEKK